MSSTQTQAGHKSGTTCLAIASYNQRSARNVEASSVVMIGID